MLMKTFGVLSGSSSSLRTNQTDSGRFFFFVGLILSFAAFVSGEVKGEGDWSSNSGSGYWSSEDGGEVVFGHEMLKYFYMQEGYVNLNHGSFGTSCRLAAEAEHAFWLRMESNPNTWFRGVYQKYLLSTRLLVRIASSPRI